MAEALAPETEQAAEVSASQDQELAVAEDQVPALA